MAYTTLSVTTPTGTTYDSENPTQGTEELNLTLHAILQDMEDAAFWVNDGRVSSTYLAHIKSDIRDTIKVVFDYAAAAIAGWRASEDPNLVEPVYTLLPAIRYAHHYPWVGQYALQLQQECFSMLYKIYYLWETETDPLRIKDFIRDMLLAWPLQDIAINLKDEGGSDLRVYPQWNNLET